MFRCHSPGSMLFSLIAGWVLSFIPAKRRKRYKGNSYQPSHTSSQPKVMTERESNISAMEKVVAEHADCTAEIIKFDVFGRRKVGTFRLLSPGHKVELRMKKGDIKIFAFGEYIDDLIVPRDSNLPRLFEENIPFEAYLGGRDLNMLSFENMDFCSIIVFYKLDGVPPTKVSLIG